MSDIIDSYYSIDKPSEGFYKEKGSKFMAYAFPVEHEEEIKEIIKDLKAKYYDARHHCYAWKLGVDDNRFRENDDGEPSGTAGKPIYGQLRSHDLTNILVVVVRYFGGTKLGVPGLIRAYKEAAKDALSHAKIVTLTVTQEIELSFAYELINEVMRIVKEEDLSIKSQMFDTACNIILEVRLSCAERVSSRFSNILGVQTQ